MSEDTQTVATVLALLQASDADKSKVLKQIVELRESKKASEDAMVKMHHERDDLEKHRKETEDHVNGELGRLEAAKRVHDDAAAEAAKRIALQSDQSRELVRLKSEHDAREKSLQAREAEVARKFKFTAELNAKAEAMMEDAKAKQAEYERKHSKLREFIS